jgi:homoserine dehydrogenase
MEPREGPLQPQSAVAVRQGCRTWVEPRGRPPRPKARGFFATWGRSARHSALRVVPGSGDGGRKRSNVSELRQVPVIQLGVGNVGSALLRQLLEGREVIGSRAGLRLWPVAVADVSGALVDQDGVPEETLRAAIEVGSGGGVIADGADVQPLDTVRTGMRPGAILVDATASAETRPTIEAALDAGCAVVLANKKPLAAPWAEAGRLFGNPRLRYEVTVGAGLPVIGSLQYLRDVGDEATVIEGCLSGTLGFLCAELERGVSFSQAVRKARAHGYTEPDPRDDLDGQDVARKALILARTAGWTLEADDLRVEALCPQRLATGSVEDFLAALPALDEEYGARVTDAECRGRVLRYVARVEPGGGEVRLAAVERESPLGALRGPANYVALYTRRYNEVPLSLAGPGAGAEVTAAGVIGDMVRLALELD